METHITPRKTYFFVFVALLVLLAATVGVHYLDLGPFNLVATLTLATVKALLVILFFMHVRYSSALTKVFVFAGFFWLALLMGGVIADYLTRPGTMPTLFLP